MGCYESNILLQTRLFENNYIKFNNIILYIIFTTENKGIQIYYYSTSLGFELKINFMKNSIRTHTVVIIKNIKIY